MNQQRSNLTNEIKRVRNKLRIFEMEGSGQLMNELMNLRVNAKKGSNHDVIKLLRSMYNQELEDLLSKQQKYKQSKMNL